MIESLKGVDRSLHEISQVSERGENKPTLEDFDISKSYVEGRLDVLVFFCIAGELDEYVALFRNGQIADQRDADDLLFAGRRIAVEARSDHLRNFCIAGSVVYGLDALGLGKDEVVFIGNVHPVKTPKRTIASEVWLLKVDPSLIRDANALYLSRSASYILAGTLVNREVCTRRRRSAAVVVSKESGGKMIESRSEIMNGISDNQANSWIDFRDILNHVLGKCRLRIVLWPKFAGVCFEKDFSPRIYITDVVVGPVDL